jgi:hypothetical protein
MSRYVLHFLIRTTGNGQFLKFWPNGATDRQGSGCLSDAIADKVIE